MWSIAFATSAARDILLHTPRIQLSGSSTSEVICTCRAARRCSIGKPLLVGSTAKIAPIRRFVRLAYGRSRAAMCANIA
jgi:hypothetical protein